jgi:hypothetical protein
MTTRTTLFNKSTRKNHEFERFLCDGQEPAILDATTSKYIPLSYFVTPHTATATKSSSKTATLHSHHSAFTEEYTVAGGRNPRRTSTRNAHGLADHMQFESFRLINVQQRGNHAHSLVLFKSRAITTNPEQIAIFECNGQLQQSEIRVIHTSPPPKEYTESESDGDSSEDEPGTVYDVTQLYFSPVSPKVCINYGNDKYNPGYCGIFGMIAMVAFRGLRPPATLDDRPRGLDDAVEAEGKQWIKKWTQLLKYMRQEIPDEPECRGCMGTNLAAQVQEIIAAHPSTATGHQEAEKEITREIKQALKTMKQK